MLVVHEHELYIAGYHLIINNGDFVPVPVLQCTITTSIWETGDMHGELVIATRYDLIRPKYLSFFCSIYPAISRPHYWTGSDLLNLYLWDDGLCYIVCSETMPIEY